MRALVGLLVAIMMIAPATAQVASWNDDAGDQTLHYGVTGGESGTRQEIPNEQGWYPKVDILRTGIYEETMETIVFEMVVSSDDEQGTEIEEPYIYDYHIYFTYHDEPMRIFAYWYHEWSDNPWAYVERLEGDYWQFATWADTQSHPSEKGWTFEVWKWELRDSQLIPAREGDVIGNIYADAGRSEYDQSGVAFMPWCPDTAAPTNLFQDGCGVDPLDFAGTESSPLGSYTLTQSPEGLGHILLETERPVRASNGLATTYVYSMKLFNLEDEPDTVNLVAANVPSGWDVYLPPRIELDAGEIKDIRMAIGVPFGHKHGEAAGLEVVAKSARDPQATSATEIVVFWPEIAQPSGHHPLLYFHSDGWRTWMNSVAEDPDEDGSEVLRASANQCQFCIRNGETAIHESEFWWGTPLRPGLFTGLDFDITKPISGVLDIALADTLPTTVSTDLVLFRENEEPLIIASQSQEVQFTSGEASQIQLNMPVVAAADRLLYDQAAALYFQIYIFGDGEDTDPTVATSLTDRMVGFNDMNYAGELYSGTSYLDLPLLDFHDEVEPGLLDSLTRLQLEAPEEILRPVNPGKTAAYFFEVLNKGEDVDTVEWQIEGPKSDWAQVVPGFTKVGSNGKATVAIRVDVPADAVNEEVADLLLVGQSTTDPDAQVFGAFIAYVSTEADIPDESERFAELQGTAEETEARGAPFPVVFALLALAVALMARRRF